MKTLINEMVKDMPLCRLLLYLQAKLVLKSQIQKKSQGLMQGCALRPLWSNLYLTGFDRRRETEGISYIRYADNMYVYTENEEKALEIYGQMKEELKDIVNDKAFCALTLTALIFAVF